MTVEEDIVSADFVIKVSLGTIDLNIANESIDEFYENAHQLDYVEKSVDKKRVKVLIPELASNFSPIICPQSRYDEVPDKNQSYSKLKSNPKINIAKVWFQKQRKKNAIREKFNFFYSF